jgi:hypothetical protein
VFGGPRGNSASAAQVAKVPSKDAVRITQGLRYETLNS